MKILTIDDSRMVRHMIRTILLEQGHDVDEAENGEAALEKIENNQTFDALLLDWEMPKMDGITFLKHVRTNNIVDNSKIIMLTSLNKLSNIQSAIESGADEYIMKPFTPEDIMVKFNATMGIN